MNFTRQIKNYLEGIYGVGNVRVSVKDRNTMYPSVSVKVYNTEIESGNVESLLRDISEIVERHILLML